MREFEAYFDDLSNWYIRRSRRRFWADDEAALRDALVRARPGTACARADPPLRRRPTLANARPRRSGVCAPRRLARGCGAGSGAPRRDRGGAARGGARPTGSLELGDQAAAAAPPARRRRRERRRPCRRGCGRAAGEGRRARPCRGGRAAGEAEPAGARAEARQGARLRGASLAAGEFEELPGGRFRAAGRELEPEEVLVERGGREGWAVASATA